MGGGGAFRAAAKVAGVTVANSGFRSVAAEHPVYTTARNVVRPVSISGISVSSEDVKSGVVKASSVGASDVSHVQKVVSDFDDWEMAGGEEEMMINSGEPLPRVVFGGAPSLQEATEATSDLKDALEKVYLSGPGNEYGGSCISSSSSSPVSKAFVVSETLVAKSVPKHAMKAFRFLNEVPAAQVVVASIASDQNVWNAVLQNPALQDFLESHKSSEKYMQLIFLKFLSVQASYYLAIIAGASSPDSDQMINESDADTDSVYQSSSRSAFSKSESEESKPGNSFTAFFHNVKQTVVDMMNSLSDYFNNLFGGDKFFIDADGTAKLGAMEKTLGASFMALAVMVMMVVVSKRGQS